MAIWCREEPLRLNSAQADPISFQRNVIWGSGCLALAAAAWAALVWQGAGADMDTAMNLPTMGLRAPLFLTIWVTMMVAMTFPTAAPMILTFHKVQAGKRQRGEAFVSTWIFVAAYLLVWSLSGVAAYAGALAAEAVGARTALSRHPPARGARRRRSARRGRSLPAGAFEGLVPLEVPHAHNLHHDIMARRRCGRAAHGIAPRCFLSRLLLAPVRYIVFTAGIMNIAAMAVITVVIFAEKTLPWGRTDGPRYGGCTHNLWFGGRGCATTAADLLHGPQHGYACRTCRCRWRCLSRSDQLAL